ncbi:hypothetical protein [Streptomyces cellulosae]|uniref:Bacterial Ig-like domain-containing protein n=1 Tax=Streptomyces cellulosae TaxID=1968 RepID=A0ABW7Y5F1_STRCE
MNPAGRTTAAASAAVVFTTAGGLLTAVAAPASTGTHVVEAASVDVYGRVRPAARLSFQVG